MINFIKELPSYLNRKIKAKKTSYSLTGIDLVIDYIFIEGSTKNVFTMNLHSICFTSQPLSEVGHIANAGKDNYLKLLHRSVHSAEMSFFS